MIFLYVGLYSLLKNILLLVLIFFVFFALILTLTVCKCKALWRVCDRIIASYPSVTYLHVAFPQLLFTMHHECWCGQAHCSAIYNNEVLECTPRCEWKHFTVLMCMLTPLWARASERLTCISVHVQHGTIARYPYFRAPSVVHIVTH